MPTFEIILQDRYTKVFHVDADTDEEALDLAYTLGDEHAIEQDYDVTMVEMREMDAEETTQKRFARSA